MVSLQELPRVTMSPELPSWAQSCVVRAQWVQAVRPFASLWAEARQAWQQARNLTNPPKNSLKGALSSSSFTEVGMEALQGGVACPGSLKAPPAAYL